MSKGRTHLVENFDQLYSLATELKDKHLKLLVSRYLMLEESPESYSFGEFEDVLLAQCRDPYTVLSPTEFFRIQDLFENLTELLRVSYLPKCYLKKLIALDSIRRINQSS